MLIWQGYEGLDFELCCCDTCIWHACPNMSNRAAD
jgi:hypothetical protein